MLISPHLFTIRSLKAIKREKDEDQNEDQSSNQIRNQTNDNDKYTLNYIYKLERNNKIIADITVPHNKIQCLKEFVLSQLKSFYECTVFAINTIREDEIIVFSYNDDLNVVWFHSLSLSLNRELVLDYYEWRCGLCEEMQVRKFVCNMVWCGNVCGGCCEYLCRIGWPE